MLGVVYGLATQQPTLHFLLAALGMLPFWAPSWHPFDVLYNSVLRPLWGGVKLPPNPLPRRIACFMGGSMNILIALSFIYGTANLAYSFGAVLIALQLIVISTHFCMASWMYERFMKLIGKWAEPLAASEARALVEQGAQLVDVREPEEFQESHLQGAINIPTSALTQRVDELRGKTIVLYCQSGLRSQEALQSILHQGHDLVYNLGAMARWEST
jgi:rhodanese-related sulfurtransferase